MNGWPDARARVAREIRRIRVEPPPFALGDLVIVDAGSGGSGTITGLCKPIGLTERWRFDVQLRERIEVNVESGRLSR